MRHRKYKQGELVIITKGEIAGIYGHVVGYAQGNKIKVGIELVDKKLFAVITTDRLNVSLLKP